MKQALHPATILLVCLAGIALTGFVRPPVLLAVLVATAGAALALCPRHVLRLARRVRVLLLALVAVFGWGTPGAAVFVDLGLLSPTWTGLAAGGLQAARLLVALALIALLPGRLDRTDLVAGLHALLQPLAVMRLPAERFTARLWLTLEYLDRAPRRSWRELRDDLRSEPAPGPAISIRLPVCRSSWRDLAALAAVAACAAVAVTA